MTTLLSPAQYNEVRAAIRLDLDATDVPDSVIELDPYAGEAERLVRVLDPNVDTYTGTPLRRAITAAVYLCAAALALALPNIVTENFRGGYSYTLAGWDAPGRAQNLRWMAYENIATNLGIEVTALLAMPVMFDLADAAAIPGTERGAFPQPGLGTPSVWLGI